MRIKQTALVTGALICSLLQGCALTREFSDPNEQQAALERWNRCLARHDTNIEHFCDGHRRDVLATYPTHMASHLDTVLAQQTYEKRLSQLLKTTFGDAFSYRGEGVPDTLNPLEIKAK